MDFIHSESGERETATWSILLNVHNALICPGINHMCRVLHVCLVLKSFLTLCDSMDYSPLLGLWDSPGKNTEWVAIPFSRGSSWPRDEPGSPALQVDALTSETPVQFSSVAQSCPTLFDPMDCSMPSFLVHHHSQSLFKLMSIKLVMPSNHLILCHPLLLLTSIFPRIKVFYNESVFHIRWPKYWSFSFSNNEYLGLISFRLTGFIREVFLPHILKTLNEAQHNKKLFGK